MCGHHVGTGKHNCCVISCGTGTGRSTTSVVGLSILHCDTADTSTVFAVYFAMQPSQSSSRSGSWEPVCATTVRGYTRSFNDWILHSRAAERSAWELPEFMQISERGRCISRALLWSRIPRCAAELALVESRPARVRSAPQFVPNPAPVESP